MIQMLIRTIPFMVLIFAAGCAVTTPKITDKDINDRMTQDRGVMFKGQEALKGPVTLEEAMARSIKYNLDHRLKIMEHALSLRQADLTSFDMLPRVVANAGYTQRNSYNASSSMNVDTHEQSLAPSTSQDKGHFNGDLTLTWNLLDFGVSYYQAKQQADRAHIMKERRRKVLHSIMQQVRQAYWQAYGAQQLEGRLDLLLKEVDKTLRDISSIEQEKLRPPLETLTYRKTLLEIMKQVEAFRDELGQAKPRLASLMNLPLDEKLVIAPSTLSMPKGPDALHYLEIRALLQRPELIEADYNERISLHETRKAILRMLPGVELTYGGHYDSNSFLVNQQWVEGGARLTWNLMNLFSGPSQYKLATSQVEIAKAQRLALSVAILTQVHVAYQDFYSRKRQYELSEQLQDVDARIYEQTMNQTRSGSQNRMNEIRSATSALMAEFRSYQNYASLQSACGQIVATLGEDPLPETVDSHEIKPLSEAIGAKLNAPGALCSPTAATAKVVPAVITAKSLAEVKPAPVVNVSLSPESIAGGQSAKLVWDAKHAAKCTIEPGIGVVKAQGTRTVAPAETTRYTVSCDGDGGTAKAAANLTVKVAETVSVMPASSLKLKSPFVMSLEFDIAQSDIKAHHYDEMKKLADFFKECPDVTIEIAGHTDNKLFYGRNMDNLKLSQRRADNVKAYLVVAFGVDPKRIVTKGYGSSKPIASNSSEEGRRKNRRIEASFKCDDK